MFANQLYRVKTTKVDGRTGTRSTDCLRVALLICFGLLFVSRLVWAQPLQLDGFVPGVDFSASNAPITELARSTRGELLDRYADWSGPKALAVSPDGSWFESWLQPRFGRTRLSDQAVIMMALERCEWYARVPCALYAFGNKVASGMDKSPLTPHRSVFLSEGRFDPNRYPGPTTDAATQQAANYSKETVAKAYAFTLFSRQAFVGARKDSQDSSAFASELLSYCAKTAQDATCILYAVGDDIVVGKAAEAVAGESRSKVQLIYVYAPNSELHSQWEAGDGLVLKTAPWADAIEVVEVPTAGANVNATDDYLPERFKWVKDRIRSGSPKGARVILIVDGIPVLDMPPTRMRIASLLEMLAKRKQ